MADEGERDRLLARAYSRASADEPEQPFLDPDTGETEFMRPSEWELRAYDRGVASKSAAPPSELPDPAEPTAKPARDADGGPQRPAPTQAPAGRRNRLLVALGVAAVLGFALGTQVPRLAGTPLEQEVPTSAPSVSPPLEAFEAVFADPAFPAVDPGPAVTDQFDATTFRVIAAELARLGDDAVQVYAAKRGGSRYCLVVADLGVRVASVCGTALQIAEEGLVIEKPFTGDRAPAGTHVVVEWLSNGSLAWHTALFAEGLD